MRRFVICAVAVIVAWAGIVVMAQSKITSLEEHAKLMKSNAQANGALNKAVGSGAFADARMQVTTLRQNLMVLQMFWKEHKNAEALMILKGGLSRLDALDKMLAAPAPDQVAAQAAAKEFGGNTCGACHKMLREGDNQTGFRFRAGASPF